MFLANENFPRPGVLLLRNHGYTVTSIQEHFPGISDRNVIRKAVDLNLTILTFDRDYGELIFRYASTDPPAVIFFRDKRNEPDAAGKMLLNLLREEGIKFEQAFSVVEEKNVRQRFYSKRVM